MALGPEGDVVAHMALPIRDGINQAARYYKTECADDFFGGRNDPEDMLASAIAHAIAVSGGDTLVRKVRETATFRE